MPSEEVEYLKGLVSGIRLRAKTEVKASIGEPAMGDGYFGMSYSNYTIKPGEVVTFVGRDWGPGCDPAFDATLRLKDGRHVTIGVGWFTLRADQFEEVEE